MTQDKTYKVSNVPPLRFPEFSGEWEKCTLGEIMSYSKDRVPSNTLTDDNYVSTENMLPQFGGIYRAQNAPSNGSAIAYQKGDTLLSNIRPYLKKVWLANNNGGCSADVFVLKSVNEKCNSDFLYYLVANDNFISYVMNGAKGVKMPRGDKEQIKKYQLSIPSKKEQCKITELLSKLDQRIATQIRVIDKLESLIKGIYNSILWREYKQASLSDIFIERNERTTSNNQYEVLSSTAKGLFRQADYFDKEVASANNVGYKVLRLGDVVLSPQNLWLGNINYNDIFEIGIVSPSYKVFSIRKQFNPYYVSCFLKTHRALYEYANASEQGASVVRRNLDLDAFMAITFPMPDKDIQDSVSKKLQAINKKLSVEKQILDKLKEQKNYLLSQMFI